MKKIEQEMLKAIKNRKDWKSGNTSVYLDIEHNINVVLHGNTIATFTHVDGTWQMTLNTCGWVTKTTSSRLNALLTIAVGQNTLRQKNWELVLDTKAGVVPFEDGMTFELKVGAIEE